MTKHKSLNNEVIQELKELMLSYYRGKKRYQGELLEHMIQLTFTELSNQKPSDPFAYAKTIFPSIESKVLKFEKRPQKNQEPTSFPINNYDALEQIETHRPDRLCEWKDLLEAAFQEAKSLPEKQKEIFHLAYKEGLINKEISVQTNTSEANVSQILKRAIAKMKKTLVAVWLFLFNRKGNHIHPQTGFAGFSVDRLCTGALLASLAVASLVWILQNQRNFSFESPVQQTFAHNHNTEKAPPKTLPPKKKKKAKRDEIFDAREIEAPKRKRPTKHRKKRKRRVLKFKTCKVWSYGKWQNPSLQEFLSNQKGLKPSYYRKMDQELLRCAKIPSLAHLRLLFAKSLRLEQQYYNYNVTVGYAMMPFSGNTWEAITKGIYKKQLRRYVSMFKVILQPALATRGRQRRLFRWAKDSLLISFKSKTARQQALVLFPLWKAQRYLHQYRYRIEAMRASALSGGGFTGKDWRGKYDNDAKLYAFIHRRIQEYRKQGHGLSLGDMRYWIRRLLKEGKRAAKSAARKQLKSWQILWLQKKIVSIN